MIDQDLAEELTKVRQVGDELALAAAQIVTEYDGVHRLRAGYATPKGGQQKDEEAS